MRRLKGLVPFGGSLASPLQFQRQQLAGLKQTNLTTVATPIIDLSNLPLADHHPSCGRRGNWL